jgi:acyl carrier protein
MSPQPLRCALRIRRKGLNHLRFATKYALPKMPEANLRDQIKEMMVENLMLKVPKEEIADDLPLFGPDGLGLDSIDALELVVSLEKTFGVSVSNSDTARQALASVNTIHDFILANRRSPAAPAA